MSLTLLALMGAGAVAQPIGFTPIGQLGGWDGSGVGGISADGTTVVGHYDPAGGPGLVAFRWSALTGATTLSAGTTVGALGVSSDGSVASGFVGNFAARWNGGVYQNLGAMSGGTFSRAFGISSDGQVIAGLSTTSGSQDFRAIRWTSAGFQDLGTLPGGGGGVGPRAHGISADGSVIVGTDLVVDSSPRETTFRWTAQTGMQEIRAPIGYRDALGAQVSGNGQTVVGTAAFLGQQAFVWTSASGSLLLPLSPGWESSSTGAVSFDGSVIGGSLTSGQVSHAAIWDSARNVLDLNVLLPALGVPLNGWILTSVNGVSADGRTLAGSGIAPGGSSQAWIATIPAPATVLPVLGAFAVIPRRRYSRR